MTAVEQELRDFIAENFLFGQDVSFASEDSLLDNGVIDSTGVLELVAFLQQRFAITIEDDEIVPDNLDTIVGISQFVYKKLSP